MGREVLRSKVMVLSADFLVPVAQPPPAHVCYPEAKLGHPSDVFHLLLVLALWFFLFGHALVTSSAKDLGVEAFVVGRCRKCRHLDVLC